MIKNVIFDFGDVIAKFDPDMLIGAFTEDEKERHVLKDAFFGREFWSRLDEGTMKYGEFREKVLEILPEKLHNTANEILDNWYTAMPVMSGVPDFIRELKSEGYHLYILSNASEFFAEKSPYFGVNQEFDGIVFSARVKMVKPNPEIYHYVLATYHLNPDECLFLDDRPANIAAAENVGIHGIVFTGDIEAVREKLEELKKEKTCPM